MFSLDDDDLDISFHTGVKVRIGSIIGLEGRVNKSAECFWIGLGFDSYDDVLFAAKFDIRQGQVTRNHCEDGSWGKEERLGDMSLKSGDKFTMRIEFFDDYLTMKLNKVDVIRFNYRRLNDVTEITNLIVKSDVTVKSFGVQKP